MIRPTRWTASCTAAICGCLCVGGPVQFSGKAYYNKSASEMASQRYAVRESFPGATFDITAGYEAYNYKGLFGSRL